MAINWRGGGVFLGGLLLGAVGAVVIVGHSRNDGPSEARAPGGTQLAALTAGAPRIDCSFSPMIPAAGREDGTLPLDKDLQAASSGAVSALILSGKEAAASGKVRDAEVAFLMACRSAEGLKSDPVPLADARYQLGRHYAQLASAPGAPRREELLRRAEGLYASSLQAYREHRGENHEKTRFALEGLTQLQQLKAGPAATPALAAASAPAAAEDTRVVGAAAPPATATPPAAAAPAPAPATAKVEAPKPAAPVAATQPAPAVEASAEPAGPTAAEREARRVAAAEREAREREEREQRAAARQEREQRAAESAPRAGTTELGAPPRPPAPIIESAPAETVVTEPPATASGDIQ